MLAARHSRSSSPERQRTAYRALRVETPHRPAQVARLDQAGRIVGDVRTPGADDRREMLGGVCRAIRMFAAVNIWLADAEARVIR